MPMVLLVLVCSPAPRHERHTSGTAADGPQLSSNWKSSKPVSKTNKLPDYPSLQMSLPTALRKPVCALKLYFKSSLGRSQPKGAEPSPPKYTQKHSFLEFTEGSGDNSWYCPWENMKMRCSSSSAFEPDPQSCEPGREASIVVTPRTLLLGKNKFPSTNGRKSTNPASKL